jgi:hypothetical protein
LRFRVVVWRFQWRRDGRGAAYTGLVYGCGSASAGTAQTRAGEKDAAEPIPVQEPSPTAAPVPGAGLSGSNRIEFDAQLIKGQTTKAGEVQVLERKDTELKSMVKRRTSFRDEIIRTAFPDK